MVEGTSALDSGPAGFRAIGPRTGGRESRLRRPSLRSVLLIVGPVALLAGGVWFYLTGGRFVSTDNAYVEADLVQLSTDVSGIVREVAVTDNQHVAAGQLLFRLDDAPYRFALLNAKAELGVATAEVQGLISDWHARQQDIRLASIDIDFATRDWKRKSDLFAQHVVPQSTMDQAQHALDSAQQRLRGREQEAASILARLGGSIDMPIADHPSVRAAKARVDEAQRDLDDTSVRAPADGIVTNVPSLQVGHYLAASTAAFGLVTDNTTYVEANPKETQLTWVRPGQHVTVTVDTYPDVSWDGTVESLSPASGSEFALLPAQNTSGNWIKVLQRIPIRIALQPGQGKPVLRAGMSAEVEIDTGHQRTLHSVLATFGF